MSAAEQEDDLRSTSERPIVRPRTLSVDWKPPSHEAITAWRQALGHEEARPLLAVRAPTSLLRAEVFSWAGVPASDTWLTSGVHAHLINWASHIHSPEGNWAVIWELLDVEDFVVEEPLLGLIDQGFRFTELFKALWEARFLLEEGHDVRPIVHALISWLSANPLTPEERQHLHKVHITRPLDSLRERLDMVLFVFTLAVQNGVLDQAVVGYDKLEKALRMAPKPRKKHLGELLELVSAVERWNRLGGAVGVVVGYDPSHGTIDSLKRANNKLSWKVIQGDAHAAAV